MLNVSTMGISGSNATLIRAACLCPPLPAKVNAIEGTTAVVALSSASCAALKERLVTM